MTVQALYQNMLLSAASYADLTDDTTGQDLLEDIKRNPRNDLNLLTDDLLIEFTDRYRVVDTHTSDNSFFQSGLAVTVFQDTETGRYVMAVRGSERAIIPGALADSALNDWVTTNFGDIGFDGVAIELTSSLRSDQYPCAKAR